GSGTFNGAVYLNVDGKLAIGSDRAPSVFLGKESTAYAVRATLKVASLGADVTIRIYVAGSSWMTLVIPAGDLEVEATPTQ
ncbi:hypothetical protein, partial [Streptococcus pneumoniae]|uniref:hypothetical protein n=1 Tax=Streptococcus pneumoniae TaxID=1313 RepID=UPI001E2A9F94